MVFSKYSYQGKAFEGFGGSLKALGRQNGRNLVAEWCELLLSDFGEPISSISRYAKLSLPINSIFKLQASYLNKSTWRNQSTNHNPLGRSHCNNNSSLSTENIQTSKRYCFTGMQQLKHGCERLFGLTLIRQQILVGVNRRCLLFQGQFMG